MQITCILAALYEALLKSLWFGIRKTLAKLYLKTRVSTNKIKRRFTALIRAEDHGTI